MADTASTLSRRQCRHCGTPFAPQHEGEHFCCAGCEAVSKMIQAQGLGHFYDLRQGISAPVNARTLAPNAFDWLPPLVAQAEEATRHGDADAAMLTLPIDGIHCVGCRWLIAELLAQQPCHGAIEVDAQSEQIRFSWHLPQTRSEPHFDVPAFAAKLHAFGYTLENPALPRSRSSSESRAAQGAASQRKRLAPRLLLCGVFTVNAIIFSLPTRLGANAEDFPFLRLFGLLVILCATLSTGLAASYFLQKRPLANPASQDNNTRGTPPDRTRAAATAPATNTRAWPRRLLGILLIGGYCVALAGQSFGLPPVFAPDVIAAASFATLLIAFALKR